MPTPGPDARGRPRAGLAAAGLLLVTAALTGCSGDPAPDKPLPEPTAADVVPLMEQVLRLRARALKGGDERDFLATIARTRASFVDRERVYFDNVSQLPLDELVYRVDETSVVRSAGGYAAVVQVHLQLEDFDEVPVVRPARFHFIDDAGRGGLLIASDRDRAWERRHDVDVQPWDRGDITVSSGAGVLGIFDDQSAPRAAEVIGAVEEGIGQVAEVVPYDWSGDVVVYALSETRTLEALDDLPAEDPHALDAVSFPVPAREGGEVLASTRFLLHPRMLDSDPQQLSRLIRHELTHVALGSRDDDVPTWLGEGIAEWVSVQPLPAEQRLISQEAIDAAGAGLDELPSDVGYNGEGQAAHYGISWWACQSIVDMYGEAMLWRLLDDLAATSPTDQDDRLQQTLQMGAGQLAREAARRIVATYS